MTMTEALEESSKHCALWYNASNNETLDLDEMKGYAILQDELNPLEDDGIAYVTFPDGEICLLDVELGEIRRLFSPEPVPLEVGSDEDVYMPEYLKDTPPEAPVSNFCVNCGAKLVKGARFCVKCGTPVV